LTKEIVKRFIAMINLKVIYKNIDYRDKLFEYICVLTKVCTDIRGVSR